jgi:hypothetical protein
MNDIVLWPTQGSFETQIWVVTYRLRNTGLHTVFEHILYRKQSMKSKEQSIMAVQHGIPSVTSSGKDLYPL